jgi:exopolysaccharide biosynthesis WecB/TagA/CpsF family protein
MTFIDALPQLRFTDAASPDTAISGITSAWKNKNDAHIVHIAYYASYVLMQKDGQLLEAMLLADNILIDGIGMQTYFKWLMDKEPLNLNGTDLGPPWIEHLYKEQIPLCLYGTTPENIRLASEKLSDRYGHNIVSYYQDGFSPLSWENIPECSALMVGMGTPRQEVWVKENIDIIREKRLLVITVGGFFDFLSGFYVRAPRWVRRIKLEWAWRTMLHPQRHLSKRWRDATIIYKPYLDKKKGYDQLVHFTFIGKATPS